jgi:hypothetical protein
MDFHPTAAKYTFFSTAQRTFSIIYPILGYKASLSKYKKIEINSSILSDKNGIKLDHKRNYRKYSNKGRLNSSLLSGQWVIKKKKGNQKIH